MKLRLILAGDPKYFAKMLKDLAQELEEGTCDCNGTIPFNIRNVGTPTSLDYDIYECSHLFEMECDEINDSFPTSCHKHADTRGINFKE